MNLSVLSSVLLPLRSNFHLPFSILGLPFAPQRAAGRLESTRSRSKLGRNITLPRKSHAGPAVAPTSSGQHLRSPVYYSLTLLLSLYRRGRLHRRRRRLVPLGRLLRRRRLRLMQGGGGGGGPRGDGRICRQIVLGLGAAAARCRLRDMIHGNWRRNVVGGNINGRGILLVDGVTQVR